MTSHSRSPSGIDLWRGLWVISQVISPSSCDTVFGAGAAAGVLDGAAPEAVDALGFAAISASACCSAASPSNGSAASLPGVVTLFIRDPPAHRPTTAPGQRSTSSRLYSTD